jgi:CheY-like chemotaxis protein
LVSGILVSNSPILHVEDEDASAFLLQAALEEAAIPNRTFRVCSGESALAFLFRTGAYKDAQLPALVILDLSLPRVDGWTVLSSMKTRHDLASIPVVILSDSDLESDKKRALHLGADKYIVKQNSIAALRRAILNACSEFISFRVMLEVARSYTLRIACIAFERTMDNGAEINVAMVLPEGAELKLVGTDVAGSVAHVRHRGRDLWMSLHDIRDNTIIGEPIRPDSPTAPYLLQVSLPQCL